MIAGEVGKPHGTSGEVYVIRISDDPRRFEPGAQFIHEDGRTLTIESSRPHRDRFLIHFEGISSRVEAEGLRGILYVDASSVRTLEENEYWEQDVLGCRVVDTRGTEVGEVVKLVPGAAHDLLEVSTPQGEKLVPFVRAIVVDVNIDSKVITVDPPEGLLD